MKTTPFLLGAGLLFWGWQAGFPVMGAVLAVVVESARWLKTRWEFSDQDFHRIWTFCSLVMLGSAVYAFNANNGMSEMRGFLQNPGSFAQRNAGVASARTFAAVLSWLPMTYFLFVAAQAYSSRQGIPFETISYILRRRMKRARKLGLPPPPSRLIDVSVPYFALCLFSASYHASENTTFFWGMAALLAWALWPGRSRRFGWLAWAGALGAAVTLGYFGQRGVSNLQRYVANLNPGWLANFSRHGFDHARSSTRIGQVGRAKLSGTIVIRLEPKDSRLAPTLLREASYRTYKTQVWYSGILEKDFEALYSERNGTNETTYVLVPGKTNLAGVSIASYLSGGKGLLPLPSGTARLENLAAIQVWTNSLGTVLERGPGLVVFDAYYGPGQTFDSPPLINDTNDVSFRELPALDQVIDDLQLRGKNVDQVLRSIQGFFQEKFTYGFWDAQDAVTSTNETPLSRFLLQTRRGHCEYFATATVLLLRRLDIPARYAVGYAVHEPAGRGYVVRQRDAHAWCLVWRNGIWQDFDTTPASWIAAEAQRASPFQFLSDLRSRIWFEISKFFYGQSHLRQYILWSLAPVLALLLFQIIFRVRRQRRRQLAQAAGAPVWPGLDSEFYQLERLFARRGHARQPGEPLAPWLRRAAADPALAAVRGALEELLRLHYRYRFDPLGLDPSERETLRRQARLCLVKITRS